MRLGSPWEWEGALEIAPRTLSVSAVSEDGTHHRATVTADGIQDVRDDAQDSARVPPDLVQHLERDFPTLYPAAARRFFPLWGVALIALAWAALAAGAA